MKETKINGFRKKAPGSFNKIPTEKQAAARNDLLKHTGLPKALLPILY
ncbi:MAG: hypothetical protein ABI741_06225 [Ferruginibacter sp.]